MALFLEWLSLAFIWMLLIGKWSATELWVGLLAAVIATMASKVVRDCAPFDFKFQGKAVAQAWRLPGYVLTGTWELLQALSKQLFTKRGAKSLLRATEFRYGADDARSRARRALVITYTSAAPNSMVLGVDEKTRLLLFHQIKAGAVRKMTRSLGAEGGAA